MKWVLDGKDDCLDQSDEGRHAHVFCNKILVERTHVRTIGGGAGGGGRGAVAPTCRQGEQTVSNAPPHFADLVE